ncbi:MAG: hypothetical protein L3J83_09935, partial [Proteobacteria bacterium]|nr:hypothetical protein [Pseudomonadota bacterium]
METQNTTSLTVNRNYTYDANGNLKTDTHKGITAIEYNYLNQPEKVVFATGEIIEYDYDASGIKLQKRYIDQTSTTTTDYLSGFQYVNTDLVFFAQPEGHVVHTVSPTNGTETNEYVHDFTDHLGNIRVSYSDLDGNGVLFPYEIAKESNYHPFGRRHLGYNNVVNGYVNGFNYGFGGKEMQEDEIAWLDFGSRNYDAELGRWFNQDPKNQFDSPYLYAFNNPINSVDPDGEFAETAILIGAGIGALIGGASAAIFTPNADFGDIFGGAVIGAFSGAATAGIGEAFVAAK